MIIATEMVRCSQVSGLCSRQGRIYFYKITISTTTLMRYYLLLVSTLTKATKGHLDDKSDEMTILRLI